MKHGCPYCEEVESYFASRQIPFVKRDIMRDKDAFHAFRDRYHGDIVPLTVFGNDERIVDGLDLPAIRRALQSFGLSADD